MVTSATIETVASAPSNTFRVSLQEDAAGKAVMNQRIARPPTFEDKYEERPSIPLHDSQVIDCGPYRLLNVAAYIIHSAVHADRPDVICVAHSHSIYGRSFCALGRPLDIISQGACVLWASKNHVVFQQFNGLILANEEGEQIALTTGEKKVLLLQNHGILTVGKTIKEVILWFSSLERCCQA
ncbi:Class II aldolase/adducin N-terminal [Elaphomyces granulatus]